MSRHLKIWASLLTLSLALPVLSRAQTAPQKSASPQATRQSVGGPEGQAGRPDGNTPPLKPMPGDQMTSIPYFTLSDGMNSTLTLNNTAPSPVSVTVTVYNTQGRSQVLPPITVDPHSFKQIELRDVVASELFDSGNLQVSYSGGPMQVTCQLSVYSPEKRVSFESREQDMMDFESSSLNGILWLVQAQAEGFLAVTNIATNQIRVQLAAGTTKKEMSLYPRETRLVKLNEGLDRHPPAAALIRLQHDGKPGDIVTTGFVLDLKNGYSSSFTMHDPKLMRSSMLAGAHIRFGQPDPNEGFPEGTRFRSPLLLGNVSDKPVVAHVSVDYTVQERLKITPIDSKASNMHDKVSNVTVKDLTVAAGDVQLIELSDEMARFDVDGPVEEAGAEITYDAAPGSLIGQLTSVDQTGDYSFEVPIKDPSAIGEFPQGVYPWTLENGVTTTLHLKNFTDQRQLAQFEIRFTGGSYSPKILVLAPHQTMAVNIRKLKDSKTPDQRGQVIPADVTHGQLWWGPKAPRTIIGRNEEVNLTEGIARSFSCGIMCCGVDSSTFQMAPGSAAMSIYDDGRPFTFQESDNTCSGNQWTCYGTTCYPTYTWTKYYNTPGSWSSSDTTVATIVNGNTYWGDNAEITTGSNGGSATITALSGWTAWNLYQDETGHYYCDSTSDTASVQASLRVAHPVNLHIPPNGVGTTGNGDLIFTYVWESSTGAGNLSDLQHCSVNERLDYPIQGNGTTYTYPSAMCSEIHNNPEFRPNPPVNAAEGQAMDTFSSCWAKPYAATGVITVTQHIQYICGTMNGPLNLSGAISMNSSITQNPDGTWRYSEDDQGYSATKSPLP